MSKTLGDLRVFDLVTKGKRKKSQCLLQISNLFFPFFKILRFCGLTSVKILGVNKEVGGSKSRPKSVKIYTSVISVIQNQKGYTT